MNIKGLNPNPVTAIDSKARVDAKARTASTADRDGNGRREQREPETKRKLSDQEFDEALTVLKGLSGVVDNNLSVRVETSEDQRLVLIVAPDGKVIRRLTEAQLWAATRDKDRQTGRILDKAM